MAISSILQIAGRMTASLGLSTGLFLLTMAVPLGVTRLPWLFPGKIVASVLAAVLPQSWVIGDPAAEDHWQVISGGGFIVLCGLFFWAAVIFAAWQWHSSRFSKKISAGD